MTPKCGAQWAYAWTTDGWADGPLYAQCPDCGEHFESDPSLAIPPVMTREELLAARERRLDGPQ